MNAKQLLILMVVLGAVVLPGPAAAQTKVVVVPLIEDAPEPPEVRPGSEIYTNSVGMKFSLIPAGSFVMGSPAGTGDADHRPIWPEEGGRLIREGQHVVTLTEPFYLQTTEVTNGHWNAVIVAQGRGENPSSSSTGSQYPLDSVNWYEAASFANWLSVDEGRTPCYNGQGTCSGTLGVDFTCTTVVIVPGCTGYRLPTESQWEYAARGATVTAFYNGDITYIGFDCDADPNLDLIGWYCGNAGDTTHPVAGKQPNQWGLYDMAGNVHEWVWDRYDDYPDGPETDPTGPGSGPSRVYRGGS